MSVEKKDVSGEAVGPVHPTTRTEKFLIHVVLIYVHLTIRIGALMDYFETHRSYSSQFTPTKKDSSGSKFVEQYEIQPQLLNQTIFTPNCNCRKKTRMMALRFECSKNGIFTVMEAKICPKIEIFKKISSFDFLRL